MRAEILHRMGSPSGSSGGVVFDLTGLTPQDPSNILASWTQSADDMTVTTDANTISNTPETAAYVERSLVDVFGVVNDWDPCDIFRAILRIEHVQPVTTDLHIGIALKSEDDRGVAWRVAAVSGNWQVQHSAQTSGGGAWAAWTAASSSTNATDGFIGQAVVGTDDAQARVNAYAIDSDGVIMGNANTPTSPSSHNIGLNFTKIRVFVGHVAGGLATPGANPTFRVGHILAKVTDFSEIGRLFL